MTILAERSYSTIDKTAWGPGPWQEEPDKLQWVDSETDLDCLIVRGPVGALCGYVGVPPEHPWHGIDYNAHTLGQGRPDDQEEWKWCVDAQIEVHGGLTYSSLCQEGEDERVGICHVPVAGRPADVFWFGFDCGHAWDIAPVMDMRMREAGQPPFHEPCTAYRTVGFVRRECEQLAEQLAAAGQPADSTMTLEERSCAD
jgi:hypothetical protein